MAELRQLAEDVIASKVFECHFMSDGGDFESLIEKHGFALKRMELRPTPGAQDVTTFGEIRLKEQFVALANTILETSHSQSTAIVFPRFWIQPHTRASSAAPSWSCNSAILAALARAPAVTE